MSNLFAEISRLIVESVLKFSRVIGEIFISFYEKTISFLVFFGLLYVLLSNETYFIEDLMKILPIGDTYKRRTIDSIERSITGVFIGSFAIGISHAIVTYIIFIILGLDFVYIATFITAFSALFPKIVSSWIVFVPVLFILYLQSEPFLLYISLGIALSQLILFYYVDPKIYSLIPNAHPYLTGLSIVLGISTFGLEGVFFGPLVIIFTVIVYRIFSSANNEDNKKKKKSLKRNSTLITNITNKKLT